MKILLTGSSGLIGKKLNGALKARGDEVLIAKRGTTSERNTVSWEIDRAELSGVGLSNLDAVVHLAGAPIAQKRWSPERKAEIYDSRINATRSIFQAVEKLEVPKVRFVIASAIGFYGDQGDKILDEKSPGGVGFLAKVTTDWEKAAAPINQDGWSVALARTGIVLDSRGGALAKQLPLFKLGLGAKLGAGTQWSSWIHINDEVSALVFLLDHPEIEGPVNLVAPNPVTNLAFTRALGNALHRPAVLGAPSVILKALLGAEMAQEMLFSSARILPSVLDSAGFKFEFPEINGALANLVANK